MPELPFSCKSDWGSYIASTKKAASKYIGAFIFFMWFLSPEVSIYLPKSTWNAVLAWNAVLMSKIVLPATF